MSVRRWGRTAAAAIAALSFAGASEAEPQSESKEPCLTAVEQGQVQRDDGKYRAARASFVFCARDVCPKLVVDTCTRWLREVDEQAPTVVLGAKNERGDDLTDVRVTLDGAPLATQLDGKPIEADAGEHVLRFEREGSVSVERKLVFRAGERARLVSVTLRTAAVGELATVSGYRPTAPESSTASEPLLSPRHVTVVPIVLGAVAAATAGVVLLVKSNQNADNAANLRAGRPPNACTDAPTTQTCMMLSDTVAAEHRDMTAATVLLAGSGGLAATAGLLWLLWPRSHASALPSVGSPALPARIPPHELGLKGWIAPREGGATLQLAASFP